MPPTFEDDEIHFENFANQQGFVIDTEKVDLDSYSLSTDEEEQDEQPNIVRVFGSNDYHLTYKEAEPGHEIDWHLHSPSMYQVGIPIQGEYKWYYKDEDGEEHSTVIGPGEVAYLPPGAYNKLEVVGDETHKAFVIEKEVGVPRVEHLVGDADDVYDPWNDPVWGLWLDTYRGEVWEKDDDAVREF